MDLQELLKGKGFRGSDACLSQDRRCLACVLSQYLDGAGGISGLEIISELSTFFGSPLQYSFVSQFYLSEKVNPYLQEEGIQKERLLAAVKRYLQENYQEAGDFFRVRSPEQKITNTSLIYYKDESGLERYFGERLKEKSRIRVFDFSPLINFPASLLERV